MLWFLLSLVLLLLLLLLLLLYWFLIFFGGTVDDGSSHSLDFAAVFPQVFLKSTEVFTKEVVHDLKLWLGPKNSVFTQK